MPNSGEGVRLGRLTAEKPSLSGRYLCAQVPVGVREGPVLALPAKSGAAGGLLLIKPGSRPPDWVLFLFQHLSDRLL